MSRQKAPKPDDAELRRLYVTEKRTLDEIGIAHGVSGRTVGTWLRDAGIETTRTVRRQRPTTTELQDLYDRCTIHELARALRVAVNTAARWLTEAGIEKRSQGKLPPKRGQPHPLLKPPEPEPEETAEVEQAEEEDEPEPEQFIDAVDIETMPLDEFLDQLSSQCDDWQQYTAAKPDLIGGILAPIHIETYVIHENLEIPV